MFFNGFNLDQVDGLVQLDVTDAVNSALLGGTQFLGSDYQPSKSHDSSSALVGEQA